jgi:hypothetical protein
MRQILLMCALLGATACTTEPTVADETTAVQCTTNDDCTSASECVQYATGESVCVRDALDQVGPAGQPPPPAELLQPVAANPRAAMPRSPR